MNFETFKIYPRIVEVSNDMNKGIFKIKNICRDPNTVLLFKIRRAQTKQVHFIQKNGFINPQTTIAIELQFTETNVPIARLLVKIIAVKFQNLKNSFKETWNSSQQFALKKIVQLRNLSLATPSANIATSPSQETDFHSELVEDSNSTIISISSFGKELGLLDDSKFNNIKGMENLGNMIKSIDDSFVNDRDKSNLLVGMGLGLGVSLSADTNVPTKAPSEAIPEKINLTQETVESPHMTEPLKPVSSGILIDYQVSRLVLCEFTTLQIFSHENYQLKDKEVSHIIKQRLQECINQNNRIRRLEITNSMDLTSMKYSLCISNDDEEVSTQLHDVIFQDNLQQLILTSTSIDKVQHMVMNRFIQLEHLDLSGNHIHGIDGLLSLPNLCFLDLSNNYLTSLDFLQELVMLKTLLVRANKLTSLKSSIFMLVTQSKILEKLDVSLNPISLQPAYAQQVITMFTNLQYFDGYDLFKVASTLRSVSIDFEKSLLEDIHASDEHSTSVSNIFLYRLRQVLKQNKTQKANQFVCTNTNATPSSSSRRHSITSSSPSRDVFRHQSQGSQQLPINSASTSMRHNQMSKSVSVSTIKSFLSNTTSSAFHQQHDLESVVDSNAESRYHDHTSIFGKSLPFAYHRKPDLSHVNVSNFDKTVKRLRDRKQREDSLQTQLEMKRQQYFSMSSPYQPTMSRDDLEIDVKASKSPSHETPSLRRSAPNLSTLRLKKEEDVALVNSTNRMTQDDLNHKQEVTNPQSCVEDNQIDIDEEEMQLTKYLEWLDSQRVAKPTHHSDNHSSVTFERRVDLFELANSTSGSPIAYRYTK